MMKLFVQLHFWGGVLNLMGSGAFIVHAFNVHPVCLVGALVNLAIGIFSILRSHELSLHSF